MSKLIACALLASSALALGQTPVIKSGATVYFEPGEVGVKERDAAPNVEGGFETYLTAAFIEVGVPLVVVTDKKKADYIIKSNVQQTEQQSWRSTYVEISANFSVIDPRSSQIVFAGSTFERYDLKVAAEDCAHQLKQFINPSEKKGHKIRK
jgi:hypothetical protein